jgi:hypothetical protein
MMASPRPVPRPSSFVMKKGSKIFVDISFIPMLESGEDGEFGKIVR